MAHQHSDATLEAAARPFTAAYPVHEEDLLFGYILNQLGDEKGMQGYFEGGRNDAAKAHRAMERCVPGRTGLRVLEFASGYGRVARYAPSVFRGDDYLACDIHPQAADFIRSKLGVAAVSSASAPSELTVPGKFDFIFVLSLFSHLPDRSFGEWLSTLYDLLNPGGALLFTTHGEFALRKFPVPFKEMLNVELGWGYGLNSDQPDLAAEEYGTMIVTPWYVTKAIEKHCPGSSLAYFEAGTWFGLQDEWVLIKPAN